jgi:hypothetical protein
MNQMPVSLNQPSVSTMPQQILHQQQQFIPTSTLYPSSGAQAQYMMQFPGALQPQSHLRIQQPPEQLQSQLPMEQQLQPQPPLEPQPLFEPHTYGNFNSVSSDISLHVSDNLKQKIWNGEFIELSQLLSSSSKKDQELHISFSNDKISVLPKKSNQQQVVSIEQWTDCFLIFMYIYTDRHPDQAKQLLHYMHTIRMASKRHKSGWLIYDEQFRLRKSKHPSSSWAVIDIELWMLCLTAPVNQTIQPVTLKPCFEFNNKGFCPKFKCPYQHRCLKCKESHPSINCIKSVSGNFRGGQASPRRFVAPQRTVGFRPNTSKQ